MDRLPIEILEKILADPKLSIQDVSNVALTCRYIYNSVVNSSVIWKWRYFEKWPKLTNYFSKGHNLYFQELQYVYNLKKRINALLEIMALRFYKQYHLSDVDLEKWKAMLNERETKISYHYLVTFLTQIISTHADIKSIEVVPFNTPGNRTRQYYAMEVFCYIKQLHLSKEWITTNEFYPLKQHPLEELAVFVARWWQPEDTIEYKCIAEELDRYAELVREELYEENPNHPLFNVSEGHLDLGKVGKLTKYQFESEELQDILEALNQVFFVDLGFETDVDMSDPKNLSINRVLETKKGPSSILLIIYESVGRRLGLILKPVILFGRLLLGFDDYEYYVDVYSGDYGSIDKNFRKATTQEVIESVVEDQELAIRLMSSRQPTNENATKLKRRIMELHKLVAPRNLINLGKLAKFYLAHNMDTSSLMNYLKNSSIYHTQEGRRIAYMLRNFPVHHMEPIKPIQRTSVVKFAVGMVMTHTRDNYKCVILDWDPICSACNTVSELNLKHEQPFYRVLREDGCREYVAQEHIIPCAEVGSLHLNQDLYQRFSHFFENHFVPNAETEKEYPDDRIIRHRFYNEMKREQTMMCDD